MVTKVITITIVTPVTIVTIIPLGTSKKCAILSSPINFSDFKNIILSAFQNFKYVPYTGGSSSKNTLFSNLVSKYDI